MEIVEIDLFDVILHFLHEQVHLHGSFINRPCHSLGNGVGKFFNVLNILQVILVKEIYASNVLIHNFQVWIAIH